MDFKVSLKDINKVINYLISKINSEDTIVLLQGDLASGKTTLVKHFVKSIGIKDEVTSPTFSLQSIYPNNIYHYDIYNKTLEEFISMGFLEEFEKTGIHFVEWGDDKLKNILIEYGFKVIVIEINKNENMREYAFKS
ncbi:MAG: tRNA (adenosine(37)-N6)-threonylcarbamoyltransferase complex ATPase subunit type 1 TsaE [Campylobacterota bacterium]|nr:tRNA (adenosine(37)-N6)-threonylcarbamoyltransferase complex ATPase subunit type 1 TsaE [Campylobacterota bacterium]